MSKISLYIAPFALESPFDFIVTNPTTDGQAQQTLPPQSHAATKLNKLVKELQDIWKDQRDLPNAHCFPEDFKWILFCPSRMTFLSKRSLQAFLALSGQVGFGVYVVVPDILAFKSDFLGCFPVIFTLSTHLLCL